MKKSLKIILFNIIFLIIVLFGIDLSVKFRNYRTYVESEIEDAINRNADIEECKKMIAPFEYKIRCKHILDYIKKINFEERTVYSKTSDDSIIIMGGSFAEGTTSSGDLLKELTGKTIYNRGIGGHGAAEMLAQLKSESFYKDIQKKPTSIIYIFIPDHLSRIFRAKYGLCHTYVNYELEDGKIVEKPLKPNNKIACYLTGLQDIIADKDPSNLKYEESYFDLFKGIILEANHEIKKHFPDCNFIIIKHPQTKSEKLYATQASYNPVYNSERWSEIAEAGIFIFDLKTDLDVNILEDKYFLPDGHPNQLTWKVAFPKLAEKIKL